MKKIALVLSLILTMNLLSGCGNLEKSTDSGDANTNENTLDSESKNEVTTISLLSWYNEQYMNSFIERFEAENPDIKIDLQFVPPVQQYVDKFMVLAAATEMTDMFFTAAENKQEIIERDLAVDISDLSVFERISPKASSTYGKDGSIYAYSPDAWVGGMFYNKDIFQEAGITDEPKTWDEFVEIVKKVKDLGYEPYVDSADAVHNIAQDLYQSSIISQDAEVDIKINKGEVTFSDFYTEPLKTWYDDLYATGLHSQLSLGLNADQAIDMFATGQTAMIHGGPWNIGTFKEKNPDLNFGIFGIPDNAGNKVLSGALNVGLSISSQSQNQEACRKFLEFMSSDENILAWQKATGNVIIVEGFDYEVGTVIDGFKSDAVKGNFYLPQIVWENSAGIYKEFLLGIQDVMTGADTIENVPMRLDQKMQELQQLKSN